MRVLFVCLGNICRSPTAAGVMRHLADAAGREIVVDSAGVGAWHVGDPPDRRSAEAARARGIEVSGRARIVTATDFDRFDLLIAMDRSNHAELLRIAPDSDAEDRVRLLREFEPVETFDLDVPDPYYGGGDGFIEVLEIAERCCANLLEQIEADGGGGK